MIIAKGLQDGKEKSIHCLNYVSTDVGVHMREGERGWEGGDKERERRGRRTEEGKERGVDEKKKQRK